MGVVYRCMDCKTKIRSPDGAAPDKCPTCEKQIASDRPDDEICLPAFLSGNTKSGDKLLRDMQTGAQVRAEVAAEAAGVPVSEMRDLVPSDFNTRRDAEIMAMPVNNEVTRHMDALNSRGGNFGFVQSGAGFAAAAGSGQVMHNDKVVGRVEPRAGARTQAKLQSAIPQMFSQRR